MIIIFIKYITIQFGLSGEAAEVWKNSTNKILVIIVYDLKWFQGGIHDLVYRLLPSARKVARILITDFCPV